MADWYPQGMDARLAWHQNFADNIAGALATKYNITAPQMATINADLAFLAEFVPARHTADAFGKQLTEFFNTIAGNDPSLDPPAPVVYAFPDVAAAPPPGIEFRIRNIRRQIKGTIGYATADGDLLALEASQNGPVPLAEIKPTIQLSAAQTGYLFSVVVSGRLDADMWQVLVQPVGEAGWTIAGSGTGKAIDIVHPGTTGKPIQLQVRVQLRRKNENYGNPSDIGQVTVNP